MFECNWDLHTILPDFHKKGLKRRSFAPTLSNNNFCILGYRAGWLGVCAPLESFENRSSPCQWLVRPIHWDGTQREIAVRIGWENSSRSTLQIFLSNLFDWKYVGAYLIRRVTNLFSINPTCARPDLNFASALRHSGRNVIKENPLVPGSTSPRIILDALKVFVHSSRIDYKKRYWNAP